jgi:F-type H+-transporting ATPase subunit b
VEANKIVADAHDAAKQLQEKMKGDAKQEIETLVVQAKQHIQAEKNDMLTEAKRDIGALVVSAVERILQEKMDKDQDRFLVKKVIDALK